MYKEKIIELATGEEFLREYSPEEIAKVEAAQKEAEELAAVRLEAIAAKAALLDKLGITEQEAKLLLS